MFTEIPTRQPATPLLDQIQQPADLRKLAPEQLPQLADELRAELLFSVGRTGGHFGAGLGVIELTIALHYLYQTPTDQLVWDVGHQTYPHKILTGRRQQMHTMRQANGLAGFPKRAESPYDSFGVGHSSTSISAALGMALAARAQQRPDRAVAIIGDGAMTAGQAFEALNHAAHERANLLVVLNDNQMSISANTGGLSTYFAKMWASKTYTNLRSGSKKVLSKLPPAWDFAKRVEEHMKGMVAPGTLFEELGFNYIGPIDGHDLPNLLRILGNIRQLQGPQLLHVITTKGKGFAPAEADPVGYHAINKLEPQPSEPSTTKPPKYQDVFGQWLCDMATQDDRLQAITPAMCEGSGMVPFARQFPSRFFDVAICEQHAVTVAAGMACEGLKPVVAIYSTFLQRAYDQLVHDVALQNLDVTFAIDRAGLVGEDGPTHHGAFDLSFMRCIPNLIIAAPADEVECRLLLSAAYRHPGPAAVRYPRGSGRGLPLDHALDTVPVGKGRSLRTGRSGVALVNFGALLEESELAAEALDASLVDMRWIKPLDTELLDQLAEQHHTLVTLEENSLAGGAGSAVLEYFASQGKTVRVLPQAIADQFVEHGKQQALRREQGLCASALIERLQALLSHANG